MMTPRLTTAALALLLFAAPAAAATVYQNGDTGRNGSSSFGEFFQAHDFQIATAETLTGVTLYALDLFDEGNGLPIFYAIYADATGLPGAALSSGVSTNFTRTDLGPQGGGGNPEYRIDFRFANPVNVAAGTRYWLGLRYGDGTEDRAGLGWVNVGGNNTLQGADLRNGVWNAGYNEANFLLNTGIAAVPEPAIWAMLVTGFGMAGAGLRRRRAVTALL